MSIHQKIKELKFLSSKISEKKSAIDLLREEKSELENSTATKIEREKLFTSLKLKKEELTEKKNLIQSEKQKKEKLLAEQKLLQENISQKKNSLSISMNKMEALKSSLENKINLHKLSRKEEQEIMQKLSTINREKIMHKTIHTMQNDLNKIMQSITDHSECIKLTYEQMDSIRREILFLKESLDKLKDSEKHNLILSIKNKIAENSTELKNLFSQKDTLKAELQKLEKEQEEREELKKELEKKQKIILGLKKEISIKRNELKRGNRSRFDSLKLFLQNKTGFQFSISEIQLLKEFNLPVFSSAEQKKRLLETVSQLEEGFDEQFINRTRQLSGEIGELEDKLIKLS